MLPTYRKIIKKAYKITIKNKLMWFLGFLVALMGNGGEYELFLKSTQVMQQASLKIQTLILLPFRNFFVKQLAFSFKKLITNQNSLFNFAIIVVIALLAYLSITAQGTLILCLYTKIKKKKKPNIKKAWLNTRKLFWDLLFTNIIFKGGGIILALLISWPFFALLSTKLSPLYSACLISFIIFVPLIVITGFLVKFTLFLLVIKKQCPLDAFVNSLKLFSKNWLIMIELAIILLLTTVLTAVLTGVLALILGFPIIIIIALFVYPLALPDGYYLTIIAWIALLLAPISGSILAVFQYSSWIILFKNLAGKNKFYSKIARTSNQILAKIIP